MSIPPAHNFRPRGPVLGFRHFFFWVLFSGGILFFTAPLFRTTVAVSDMLVIPRDPLYASAAGDLSRLPVQISFYDRVLKRAPDLRDPWTGESALRRLTLWNRHVAVKHFKGSNVLRLTVSSQDPASAELLARTVNQVLAGEAAYHYGVGKVEIHPLDGPLVRPAITPLPIWIVIGLSGGALLTAILFSIGRWAGRLDREPASSRETRSAERIRSLLARDLDLSAWPQAAAVHPAPPQAAEPAAIPEPVAPKETKSAAPTAPKTQLAEPVRPKPAKMSADARLLRAQTVRQAPTNLPGIDASEFSWDEALQGALTSAEPEDVLSAPAPEERPAAAPTAEPSAEDFKRRLNELLQGKM